MLKNNHITVCICTYKRPELLERLLSKLEGQETKGFFDYSAVVVDNDSNESARETVTSFTRGSSISVNYDVEPEQNIALARNRAVANAEEGFIGFIDDDEFPSPQWLLNLYQAIVRFSSDGVLGPVLPHFDIEPPGWVIKGRFFYRPSHTSGSVLDWKFTRTGNALLRKELFGNDQKWFDAAFGSGGEDRDFFRRKIEEGYVFVWCNEAPVYETIPPNRWLRTVLLKRALIRGKMAFHQAGSSLFGVLKSAIAVIIYTCGMPVFFVLGHHVLMKYLIKTCDHLGKILAFLGIDFVKEKYIGGSYVKNPGK